MSRYSAVSVHGELTQLVKVRVAAVGSWYRADQTGLEECRPLVHQTSLPAHVILIQHRIQDITFKCVCECERRRSVINFHHLTKLNFLNRT